MKLLALAIVALGLSTPALAQTDATASLGPGQAVTITLDADGKVARISDDGQADWNPYDVAAARHLTGQPIPDAPVPVATPLPRGPMPQAPAIPPGTLRVKFMSIAGRHSLLVIENGHGRALVYRARMTVGGRTQPTDVCLVIPNQRGYEHWPHPIERIELFDFSFTSWEQGQPIPCR